LTKVLKNVLKLVLFLPKEVQNTGVHVIKSLGLMVRSWLPEAWFF